MRQLSRDELEEAKLAPASVFATPQEVLTIKGLSKDVRLTILKRWELDANALLRAGDEGMGEGSASGELLQAVRKAIEVLDPQ